MAPVTLICIYTNAILKDRFVYVGKQDLDTVLRKIGWFQVQGNRWVKNSHTSLDRYRLDIQYTEVPNSKKGRSTEKLNLNQMKGYLKEFCS